MKTISLLFKFLSVLTGLAAYANIIPAKYAPLAVLVFAVASTLKDLVAKIGDWLDDGEINGSYQPDRPSNGSASKLPLIIAVCLALPLAFLTAGCHTPNLESGGAYAPAVVETNSAGVVTVTPLTAPETALFIADGSFKLAYNAVHGVLIFERDNRTTLAAKFPQLKPALDKIRPQVWAVEQRWAIARYAYKSNPTPAGLSQVQSILAEIQRLVPVAQAELTATITTNP